jgi:hypothetical protein
MSITVNSFEVSFGVKWDKSSSDAVSPIQDVSSRATSKAYASGTGAGKVNKVFRGQYTIAASGNQQLDLAGGVTDFDGVVMTFTKVREIIVELTNATAASEILVGGGTDGTGTNAFATFFGAASHKIRVGNGGVPFHTGRPDASGWDVTAGTGDILRIENADGSNAATVNVFIAGE